MINYNAKYVKRKNYNIQLNFLILVLYRQQMKIKYDFIVKIHNKFILSKNKK